jgi:ParB family chromosome partitioning protein
MKTATAIIEVEQIKVASIFPSPTNPRKHIDQVQLEELAQSIRSVGIQVPLMLRQRGDDATAFEIVGGERRWRAAQLAGLDTVPAIAKYMTDEECRETQLIENLQRADLGPMEEAEAYGQLMLPIEVLAAKVGKTVPYVAQRIKLLSLIPEGRAALRNGVLNLSLALLIARLQPSDQSKAVLYAIDPNRITKGKGSLGADRGCAE